MKTSAAPNLEIRNPIGVYSSTSQCNFVTIRFSPFARLFFNLAMHIGALFPKSASILRLVEQAFRRMPFFTEWSGASSFEVILAGQSSHSSTGASASWTSGSRRISLILLRRRARRKIRLRHFEAYGFLNPVIIQCDKEMSIIDVCRKVACERNARTNSVTICAKNKSSQQRFCRSSTRTHTGNRTMLLDTNRDEHWHTAFSYFTCHSICDSLRWLCALKIHSATRRQNTIPIFARNTICITFVHVW